MTSYFIPYSSGEPASVVINGHRLIVVGEDKNEIESHLALFGGDSLMSVEEFSSPEEQEEYLQGLARSSGAGIVLAPHDIGIDEVLSSLEAELPWIH